MEEGVIAKVINDFLTINEGEICLNKGDIVQITRVKDRHWCYGRSSDKEGLIPTDYVMEIEVPIIEENQELFASVADFIAQQAGDLSFEKGEVIIGLQAEGDNWWRGMVDERVGLFPTTYVWKLNSSKYKKKSQNLTQCLKALVTTSMKAQLDEEMDLNEGEIITITGVVDKIWYRGVCGDREGIFPKDFVKLLNEDEGMYPEQYNLRPNVSLPLDSYSSGFADYSVPTPKETYSGNEEYSSLINFSPEEQKLSNRCTFSSNEFNSVSEELSDVFQSLENKGAMLEPASYETHGIHMDNLGISPYGITLYPFYGQFDNELSFHEGEIVTLVRHIDGDWVEGEIDGRRGIMPVSYVNIVVDCGYSYGENDSLRQNSTANVMHNFNAQINEDISVREGVDLFTTETVEECRVRDSARTDGLFPMNYMSSDVAPKDPFSPLDGLPTYTDIFKDQQHSMDMRKSQATAENMSHHYSPLSNNRPKSVDDMIAKNIASLDLIRKSKKISSSGEIKAGSLDMGTSSHKLSSQANVSAACGFNSDQNSTVKVERPTSLTSRLSLPANLVPSNGTSVHGAVQHRDEDGSSIEVQKTNSELPNLDDEHIRRSPQEFTSQDVVLRRQGSDRVPHRPAPPIPRPGQIPMRRSLKRNNLLSRNPGDTNSLNKARGDEHSSEMANSASVDKRIKDSEQRQNVISELAITEKEYVRDLKLTYEAFNLDNEEFLECRGIDVKTVFGNITEVIQVAEELYDKILFSMKNRGDDEQLIGPCFLQLADRIKLVYSTYCMNHDTAITLLEKYESNEDIQKIFNKGIETLKYQIPCFDMGSILIKPVQRILKYPLILNELIKCTDDTHKDKRELLDAVDKMTDVASHINELRRRKDLVSKYLGDGNATLSNRMSKLSLHSVLKKSSRLGMKLSSTLGIGLGAKDPEFDDHELLFRSLEKSIKIFFKNMESFYSGLEEFITCQCTCGEILNNCFKECNDSGISEFIDTHNKILTKDLVEFRTDIESRVLKPLTTLLDLFEGPDKLIQKRNDKLLDYNRALAKPEKSRESRSLHDEILLSKNNYDALNSQLLEELPKLIVLSNGIFLECIAAFLQARKLFSGKATKKFLSFCEKSTGDVLEVFSVKHNLVNNQIGRFSFVTKNFSCEPSEKTDENKSPILGKIQRGEAGQAMQCQSQLAYLQSRYPMEKLYLVKTPYISADEFDLCVSPGNVVAVIKNQDPMGNNKRWFVDKGGSKGFLPSSILEPKYKTSDERSTSEALSRRHSTEQKSLFTESVNESAYLKDNSSRHNVPYYPPPAYEEVCESDGEESPSVPQSQTNYLDQRYEEPCEDSNFSSHVYAEIPDEDSEATYEFYYALYDFNGSGLHTLPIISGQVLKVKNFHDLCGNPEWWLVEDRGGKSGYVPGNYLKKYN